MNAESCLLFRISYAPCFALPQYTISIATVCIVKGSCATAVSVAQDDYLTGCQKTPDITLLKVAVQLHRSL